VPEQRLNVPMSAACSTGSRKAATRSRSSGSVPKPRGAMSSERLLISQHAFRIHLKRGAQHIM
jgi:hypothetical protein